MLLVTLLTIGLSVLYFTYQNESTAWQGRQGEAARHAARIVTTFVQQMQNTLLLVSVLNEDILAAQPMIMDDLLQRSPTLLEIVRLDAQGHMIASAYRDDPLLANLFTIPQARWFNESRAGRLYLGEVQISASREPYLIISIPAADGGVAAARLHMQLLWEVVADLRFGETGQAYVVNRDGKIIAHTDSTIALANRSLAGRPELAALWQAPQQTWQGSYLNFEGIKVVGVTAPLPGTDWVIVTELPQAEAFATSRTALLLFGGGLILFGLLVTLVARYFLGQMILQPIENLQAGADRIGQGDLDYRLTLSQRDELGRVATAFNAMAARLQDREARLIVARDQALAASHLKTELLAKVSHELRTPLGAIMGFAEMLDAGIYGPITPEQHQTLAEIIDSSTYLTTLVNELLDQAQLEAGKYKLDIQTITPAAIVEPVLAKMSILAQNKGVKLIKQIDSTLPPTLSGDPARLQQILVNLVSNAIKFTAQGTVQVHVFQPDADHWAIQVADTGMGIPPEAQAYVFEPFRQVDGSITRTQAGSGLGLSIVKQLAELMGGQVTLESNIGQGSIFTVLLPL
jgi:signal transduction histidine kinase